MNGTDIDARSHLESLVGRPFRALNGRTMTVLDVQESVAVVRAGADDEVIPVAWVKWGVDRLLSSGEVRVLPSAFGSSTEIVVMLLLTLPGAHMRADGTAALEGWPAWNIRAGEAVDRLTLHARFGGNTRTRIAPSASTPNVFVFVDPQHEGTGLWEEGVLHVRGERVRGNAQSNANRALADHRDAGRALRVFWRSGEELIYTGAFQIDPHEPFYFTEAQQIVFRLVPAGTVAEPEPETPRPVAEPVDEPPVAERPASVSAAVAPFRALSTRFRTLIAGLDVLGRHGPWPAIVLASCAAVALTTWAWTSAPVRPAVTTWFLLLCPGMAVVRLLPDRGLLLRLVLAVAASLALETLVATFMLEAKAWAPSATLGILLLLTVAATGLELRGPRPRVAAG